MIEVDEFVYRLCRLGARTGPRRFPRERQDREILIKSILMPLENGTEYSEQEINPRLLQWNRELAPEMECDYVTLRRLLVGLR
jgi:hypothetical protein